MSANGARLASPSRREEELRSLGARLSARRAEIERDALTRVHAIADSRAGADPAYAEGLRGAVTVALDHGLAGIGRSESRPAAIPLALLSQARLAARSGIGLDTILRRYVAGHAVLNDYLIEEAKRCGVPSDDLQPLLRSQGANLDRLLAAVSEEHKRESGRRPDTSERQRAEQVRRLLAGELLDGAELAYELDGFHVGLLAVGLGTLGALQELASGLDCRLLSVCSSEGTVWAWLGTRRSTDPRDLQASLSSVWPAEAAVAFGEPAEGLHGWRFSHRQAKTALPVAVQSGSSVVRYADVALLAAALQDELLATSLRRLYLDPLRDAPDGGAALKETLRAYFAAGGNVASAAAAAGLNRHTVANRLRTVEGLLDRALDSSLAGLELALQLEQLSHPPDWRRR